MAEVTPFTVLWARVETGLSERRELTQALMAWVEGARREHGVVGAYLSEDVEEPGTYCLSSTWRRREDLETHVAGPDFGVLIGALEVLGRRTALTVTSAEAGTEDPAELVRRIRGHAPSFVRRGGATGHDLRRAVQRGRPRLTTHQRGQEPRENVWK